MGRVKLRSAAVRISMSLSGHPSPVPLDAQDRECVECASEVGTGENEGGIA